VADPEYLVEGRVHLSEHQDLGQVSGPHGQLVKQGEIADFAPSGGSWSVIRGAGVMRSTPRNSVDCD
jgi:hypothetical protein